MRASTWSADEQVLGAAEQHHLLGRVAAAGEHLEDPRADAQGFPRDQAPERARQAGDHAQIAMAVGEQLLRGGVIEPVRAVEAAIRLGIERARIKMNGEADEVFGLAHGKREAKALAEPAGEPDVIGMIVGDQDAGQRPAAQRAVEQRFPGRASRRVVEAYRDRGPRVLNQVGVDVIEAMEARGAATGCQARPRSPTRLGRRRMRKANDGARADLSMVPFTGCWPAQVRGDGFRVSAAALGRAVSASASAQWAKEACS